MDRALQAFWNALEERGLVKGEERLTESLRIWLTRYRLLHHDDPIHQVEEDAKLLYQVMEEEVGKDLGHFPGDRDLFFHWYHLGKDLDVIHTTEEILKNDRIMAPLLPDILLNAFAERIKSTPPRSLLIAEAEKFLPGLKPLLDSHGECSITLTTERWPMFQILTLAFGEYANVTIRFQSIYKPMDLPKFDSIFSVPVFGGRLDPSETDHEYLTNETEGVGMENLLRHLTSQGTLSVIVPAKLTFGGGGLAALRREISEAHQVHQIEALPEGTFRPYTGIKTYWITLSREKASQVYLSRLRWKNQQLVTETKQTFPAPDFAQQKDWRVELFLADEQTELGQYQASDIPKIKLKEAAEIFRGKSIMKKDIRPGEISVLNISNIEEGEIRWEGMDTIDEELRKVKRYELEPGDLVMTCRGTVNKFAVVDHLPGMTIASANIIVMRFREKVDSTFAKIFMESPVGTALVKSFQRGGSVMNINPGDIGELEIPLLKKEEQRRLIEQYRREWERYRETIREAEKRWNKQKQAIYLQIIHIEGDSPHGNHHQQRSQLGV